MCKYLAGHGKHSYPSIIETLRLGFFSFIQRDHDALVPFLRNHFLWKEEVVPEELAVTYQI